MEKEDGDNNHSWGHLDCTYCCCGYGVDDVQYSDCEDYYPIDDCANHCACYSDCDYDCDND